jgi:16S rRNA (adenine1518-N6/adenine1519-N6)-dimethyltransferase
MSYENKNQLIDLLKDNDLFAKKHLGQNFLISKDALGKIVQSASITNKDNIIEIGPGLGILTKELAKQAKQVTSYELDSDLIPVLNKLFELNRNVNIVLADALKITLPSEPYKLVANIPYYITSPILMHFLHPKTVMEKRPTEIVLLIQKEVAEKVCAKQGNHSVLSLQIQIFGQPEIAGTIKKDCFYPSPKVDSAILHIKTYSDPIIEDVELFLKTIKTAFTQRRKTLLNSLRNGFGLKKEVIEKILATADIKESLRPQELSFADWERLIAALQNAR